MVELYDADPANPTARLVNISNRGFVDVGDRIMIPGFVVSSEGSRTFLIRAVGPGLFDTFGLTGVLEDPVLTVFRGSTAILDNDDWGHRRFRQPPRRWPRRWAPSRSPRAARTRPSS
jgi:hypothetical protein